MAEVPPPGGETLLDVQRLVVRFVDQLRERHAGQTVLVITHAGTIAALACWLRGLDLNDVRQHAVSNCGLSSVQWVGEVATPSVDYWDEAGLPVAAS